jgi:hypothetical protein
LGKEKHGKNTVSMKAWQTYVLKSKLKEQEVQTFDLEECVA